ncbi:MAG: type II toxin-antitoxin system VapC family toxin [Calditrichia bacterium]
MSSGFVLILLDKALRIVDDTVLSEECYQEAFALAVQAKTTVYDALYLVAARRQNAHLASADNRLVNIAKKRHIRVITDIDI